MPLPSNSAPPIEDTAISKGEILDLLSDDTELEVKEPVKEPEKEVEKEPEEVDEEKEPEIKLAEDEEEEKPEYDENDIDIIAPARRQEILKKYPTLFKDFPHLEKAYFRDQQYNELFGTPDEAKEIVERVKSFDDFSDQLLRGNTQNVLSAVKNQNPDAFAKIVDTYLTTLKDVDDKAFFHVVSNTLKSTVASMVQEAQRSNNEDLLNAARILHQYVTGTTEWQEMKPYGKKREEVQEENQLNQERLQFFQERFETVQSDLQSRVDGVLKNTIDQNMDPKSSMTGYVKRVAVNEAFENVQKAIRADSQFVKLLDRLWEKAAEDKFSKNSVDRIRSAYLAKAKTLLPAHIKKSRIEALKGLGKRVRESSEEEDNTPRTSKRESASPQLVRGSNRNENPSKGKSTLQFLNED